MTLHLNRSALVSGPIGGGSHGFPGTSTSLDIAAAGYVEREFFVSGDAVSYVAAEDWASDGQWSVTEGPTARFTTRILVRTPTDPSRFNGTVVVEWLNVSGNTDIDVDFGHMNEEITRGYAWVGVSAQAAGITSTGGSGLGDGVVGLLTWDPERYGALDHPGDHYSYDIFSQVGAALRAPGDVDPLGGLIPTQLLAAGQSQSGFRMLTYANAVHSHARVFDGMIIHARGGIGAPLGDGMMLMDPAPARVRTDLDVPVFQLITETELFELCGGPGPTSFVAARQPDTDLIRTWEIAGTAHSDAYSLKILHPQYVRQFSDIRDLAALFPIVNDGPQRYVANAALRGLRQWAAGGAAPTSAPVIDTADNAVLRDRHGNATGGVRTPQLDVPIATLTGELTHVPHNGATITFDAATLTELYPSHDVYVTAFSDAARRAVDSGFLLPEDAAILIADAQGSDVGR
ncbi:hypothetical protein C7T36_16795 [Rhodococcus sp. AD45-ID]|uniref:alpha/beta hydrolase domain-containing protein n=1 Tax=unclassified Rhodococcus (in: high G+C Gram-positive bacteria) TaxID=192944 RepID=UPI0005DE3011|nr:MULTISPECIES: alpha/beta hydrolase domain-containing protein [unclassified Rhodococcus (in: high G+C Gram-positive bacteria)]KJF19477.1 hypothetical protein SZ00_05898 [Rhodococcus sp. AD45]PSR39384.1 hypothetical protein C7T36_16795 [Rhodococcus sp. AD45-ID]